MEREQPVAFKNFPIGSDFQDLFDGGDFWRKVNERQAMVLAQQLVGSARTTVKGSVHDIGPDWKIKPLTVKPTPTRHPINVAFKDFPIGSDFQDLFDCGDFWRKVNERQAMLLSAMEFGPNVGKEGSIHDIDPDWTVEPLTVCVSHNRQPIKRARP